MSVSVYLSNQMVQVAVGTRGKKPSLTNVYTANAPDGSIINGIIMDQESFISFLKQFWAEKKIPQKDIYLIVNSSKIADKNLNLPKLSEKKAAEFIMREFAEMQREEEENTLAYITLGKDPATKTTRIYANMATKDQLKEYKDIFEAAGISVRGIISGEGSIIGYAFMTIAQKYKTFVLQIANGNLVSNVLFVDGVHKYFNSIRSFNIAGTNDYFDDCARSLNNLEQFMRSEKIESAIEQIVVAGVDDNSFTRYQQSLADHGIDVPSSISKPMVTNDARLQYEAQAALFAVSGLYDMGKESNFLTHFDAKEKKDSTMDPDIKRRVVIIGTTLAVMLVLFAISLAMRLVRQGVYKDAYDYNKKPAIVLQVNSYDDAVEKRDALLAKYKSINYVSESIDSYPVPSEAVLNVIEETARGYADIEILSFDAEAGLITFSAKADNVNDIYKYIDKLLAEDIFMSVEHTGYTLDEREVIYDIHVTCTLAEAAGREEK